MNCPTNTVFFPHATDKESVITEVSRKFAFLQVMIGACVAMANALIVPSKITSDDF